MARLEKNGDAMNIPEPPTVVNIHKINGKRPDFDIYIGRTVQYTEFTANSIWANPYLVNHYTNPADCLVDYERYIKKKIEDQPGIYDLNELTGKRLGCWCKPGPCHGDILVKIWKQYKNWVKKWDIDIKKIKKRKQKVEKLGLSKFNIQDVKKDV